MSKPHWLKFKLPPNLELEAVFLRCCDNGSYSPNKVRVGVRRHHPKWHKKCGPTPGGRDKAMRYRDVDGAEYKDQFKPSKFRRDSDDDGDDSDDDDDDDNELTLRSPRRLL